MFVVVALQGMSFQDLFEFKKMEDYFIDVDDWKKCLFRAEGSGFSHAAPGQYHCGVARQWVTGNGRRLRICYFSHL